MITIVAQSKVKPECIEAFKKAVAPLIELSQKEEGCHAYFLYQDIENPSVLTFIEDWADEAAIEKHKVSKHFQEIFPTLNPYLEAPVEVHLYKKL